MPGKMVYALYTSNDSNQYNVKIRKFLYDMKEDAGQGGNASLSLLKFDAFDATKPLMPAGMKMRYCRVQDATGGITRKLPVGTVASRVWTEDQISVELDYSGISGTETFNVVGFTEEHAKRIPHTILNESDAA